MNERSLALDALRGITLAMMILVNTPGSWSHVYPPLLHANWHGVTPTDFVFPFFLFIVGCALFFSNRKNHQLDIYTHALKIFRRTVLLLLAGLGLHAYLYSGTFAEFRLPGVLQRIALAYGAAAFIVWLPVRARIGSSLVLLLLYIGIFALASGGYTLVANPVRHLDLWVLGAGHLWQGKGIAFDPEGLLSTLPAIVTVLSGYEATRIIVERTTQQKVLVIIAALAIGMALLLHPWVPINKYLWTSSYVLLTSGVAVLVLVALMQLESFRPVRPAYRAFAVYGENPLLIYILAGLWVKSLLAFSVGNSNLYASFYHVLSLYFSDINASLAFAIFHVALFWLIALWLHNRGILVRL